MMWHRLMAKQFILCSSFLGIKGRKDSAGDASKQMLIGWEALMAVGWEK